MKYRPILFNTDMVRAILEGRKTQTRRIVKQRYSNTHLDMFESKGGTFLAEIQNEEKGFPKHNKNGTITHKVLAVIEKAPPCNSGDVLWVRETWDELPVKPDGTSSGAKTHLYYKADGDLRPDIWKGNWRPSIHMPKEAARIFLRVTDVFLEHLNPIKEIHAEMEGADPEPPFLHKPYTRGFVKLWNSTIPNKQLNKYGYDANPWVWVIMFERIPKPEGWPDV